MLRIQVKRTMKFKYKQVSRPLEDALGIPAFEIETNGEPQSIVVVKEQLDEFLDLFRDGGRDCCANEESAAAVAELSAAICSLADIATRVRDHIKVTDLQGYSYTEGGGKDRGCYITTPFGVGPEVYSFPNIFYRTSDACMSGLPPSVGIGILQQAIATTIRLRDRPIGSGMGSRAGFLPTGVGK